jgi:excisionase family DNA binding protein
MSQLSLPFDDHGGAAPADNLTIAEAAQRVRCCERTIRRAIDAHELRAGRVRGGGSNRGTYRIRPSDLEAWLFREDGDVDQ